jgi:hypothetical protein
LSDAVEITADYYCALLRGQSEGKAITSDEKGYPILTSPTALPPSREQIQAEAKFYLSSTDWYVTRKIETGKEIPEEVSIKRAEARDLLK